MWHAQAHLPGPFPQLLSGPMRPASSLGQVFTGLSALSRYGRHVSAQRTRSAVAADHRSIISNISGVPWWAAVVVAVTCTAAGFAFDAGSGKELTTVFSALYVAGCVVAVLVVRQSGVFTAVIQPPLILFCAVPGAYWLFHGAKFTGLKDLLINCGYPLIERFPLMVVTSGAVLIIGIIRWMLAAAVRSDPTAAAEVDAAGDGEAPAGLIGTLMSKFAGLKRDSGEDTKSGSQRAPAVGRSAKPARSARPADARRTAKRPATTRSRQSRRPLEETADSAPDRARRRRAARPRDVDGAEPPRRGRVPRDPDLGGRPSREIRRDPHTRRARPTRRSSRFDPYEPIEPNEPYEPYEPSAPPEPRRRPVSNGTSGTHHPISQVRYRGSTRSDGPRGERPRRWDYDA